MKRPTDWVPTGEQDTITTEDWWCPSKGRWSMCSGPCPDGREHGPKRVNTTKGNVFVSPSTGWRCVTTRSTSDLGSDSKQEASE